MTIKEIALEILYKYEEAQQIIIDEYSVNSDQALNNLRLEVNKYAEQIDNATIEPERKKGKWVDGKCSACGGPAPYFPMASTYYKSDFCPNCGAEMSLPKEPERKKGKPGKWINGVCDKCGFDFTKLAPISILPAVCPNCGDDKRGNQNADAKFCINCGAQMEGKEA